MKKAIVLTLIAASLFQLLSCGKKKDCYRCVIEYHSHKNNAYDTVIHDQVLLCERTKKEIAAFSEENNFNRQPDLNTTIVKSTICSLEQ